MNDYESTNLWQCKNTFITIFIQGSALCRTIAPNFLNQQWALLSTEPSLAKLSMQWHDHHICSIRYIIIMLISWPNLKEIQYQLRTHYQSQVWLLQYGRKWAVRSLLINPKLICNLVNAKMSVSCTACKRASRYPWSWREAAQSGNKNTWLPTVNGLKMNQIYSVYIMTFVLNNWAFWWNGLERTHE